MPWTLANFKDLASAFQSVVTPIALIAGGLWAYRKYVVEDAKYPHIQTSAEISFLGRQGNHLIVELKAVLENKGKVQHKIGDFGFDLNALFVDDPATTEQRWGGQVHFPHEVAKGSFKPESFAYFVLGPGVTGKYSYIARVPLKATFLILHCWFEYSDDRGYSHSMETTVKVPDEAKVAPQ